MKRQTILILAVALAAGLLMGTAMHPMAKASRIDFTVTEYVCGLDLEKYWQEGNVMHIRGYEHQNVNVSITA